MIRKASKIIVMHIQKHVTHTYHYRDMIKYMAKNYKGKDLIGVEIGVLRGLNAYSIMHHLPMKRLYLVDPYILYDDNINTYQNRDKDLEAAHKRMVPFKDKVCFIKQKSEDAYKLIPSGIDFVYIDGNHLYEYVKKDLELYYPLLKSNGVIGGHDFRSDTGVAEAVLEFTKKHNLQFGGIKVDWWIVKP